MATCSFISAAEARNTARNNTLIWTEICEVQTQILTAIDANLYSVLVNDDTPMTATQGILTTTITDGGSDYFPVTAGATIIASGTAGTGATVTPIVTGTTITGFTVDTPGTGYTPINVTASVGNLYELIDAQDETDYDNSPTTEGTFAGGTAYRATEIIGLSEGSTITVDTIDPGTLNAVLNAGETDVEFDGVGSNGTFVGGDGPSGTTYQIGTTITMSDGSVINITSIDGDGDVDGFTVAPPGSTSKFVAIGATLSQVSTTSVGVGFTLSPDTNNTTPVGAVTEFTVNSAGVSPFNWPSSITQSSTDGIGTGFTLIPDTANINEVAAGTGAILTPIVTDGNIIDVAVNVLGSGYLSGSPVLFTHPSGTGASATVTSVNGSGGIVAIGIVSSGSGYEQATATVTVTAPGGLTPAVAFAGVVVTSTAASANDYTSLAFDSADPYLITRTGGTAFDTDGFVAGTKIIIANAEDVLNNGTYTISDVTDPVITVTEAIATTNADDITATITKTAVVTGISIQEGGSGYAELFPTVSVTDATGSGAVLTTNVAGGEVTAINIDTAGSGYTAPTLTIVAAPTSGGTGATATATAGTNTFGTVPTTFNDVLVGQTTDAVILDQITYVSDYFTALGYNIRAQTNSTTMNTIQWSIIW